MKLDIQMFGGRGASSSSGLSNRLSGDALLDAQDLAYELKSVGANRKITIR